MLDFEKFGVSRPSACQLGVRAALIAEKVCQPQTSEQHQCIDAWEPRIDDVAAG